MNGNVLEYNPMNLSPGKIMILAGLLLVAAGWVVSGAFWFGHLPGDWVIKRDHFSFYFPLTTCMIMSAVISLIIWLLK